MSAEAGAGSQAAAALRREEWTARLRSLGILIPFTILFVVLSLTESVFLTRSNMLNILDQQSATLIIAAAGTLVVIAGGIDVAYPPENAALQNQIAERGVLIAEQPAGVEPKARHFAYRNRIIAGIREVLQSQRSAAT